MASTASAVSFEGFHSVDMIGQGSYGHVFAAVRSADGLRCVIKRVQIQGLSPAKQAEARREVQVLSELKHPHVVRYFDSFGDLDDTRLHIVMEYCDAGDLSALLARRRDEERRALGADEVMDLFDKRRLAHMHKQRTPRSQECERFHAPTARASRYAVKVGDLSRAPWENRLFNARSWARHSI